MCYCFSSFSSLFFVTQLQNPFFYDCSFFLPRRRPLFGKYSCGSTFEILPGQAFLVGAYDFVALDQCIVLSIQTEATALSLLYVIADACKALVRGPCRQIHVKPYPDPKLYVFVVFREKGVPRDDNGIFPRPIHDTAIAAPLAEKLVPLGRQKL